MNKHNFPPGEDATFLVNPSGNQGSSNGSIRQRPPVSASEFSHMFTPLPIERMFQMGPTGGGGDTQNSASIMGMLWHNNDDNEQAADAFHDGAGDTLKQLLSNGSNPTGPTRQQEQQEQQERQERQEQFMAMVESESLITPSSPPETVGSQGSAQEEAMTYSSASHHQQVLHGSLRRTNSVRSSAALPSSMPNSSMLNYRRSVNRDSRNMPPIPSSPQLRSASRMSFASYHSSNTNGRNYAVQPPASARPSGTGAEYGQNPQQQQQQQRYLNGRSVVNRPHLMYDVGAVGDFTSHPLQVHSAVVPSTRYQHPLQQQQMSQGDQSLRHEVLDKVARRSQPTTPFDNHGPISNNQRPPSSVAQQRRGSPSDYILPQQPYTSGEITILPGDNRLRPYVWNQSSGDESENQMHRQRQTQLKSSNSYTAGVNHTATAARFGSIRRAEQADSSQVRKTSDSKAQLLKPENFRDPLPDRIGDMVLDKRLGEWVNINDYLNSYGGAESPNIRPSAVSTSVSRNGSAQYHQQQQQQQQQQQKGSPVHAVSGGPASASARSSVSMQSQLSAFPQPLPTGNNGRNTTMGMGLVSPVENQRVVVREMAERKVARSNSTVQRRNIEDEALGSIVQRLVTPATSPNECTALDLSGSGIRNLSGLAQITSRLEAICLASNKLQSLAGLPTGLVSLRAPSNWIRFNVGDADKFSFARELPHLEEIDLSANEIADISVFSGLRHLRVLELSRNRIESLSELRGCRRLIQLGLRDNIMTRLDLDASEAPLLQTLDVFNNRLRVVPATIAEFVHLAKVNIIKNDLEHVELHGPAAESMRELRLSENPLLMRRNGGIVDVSAWRAKFPCLKTLYLDICNIRELSQSVNSLGNGNRAQISAEASPVSWASMFNLSLRGNALQPLLSIDFNCLSSLKNLYAPDTRIALPRSLPIMNYLVQLVMCNAGIPHLPSNLGSALPQLRLLDVSNNPDLIDISPILQLAPSLEVLKCRSVGFGDGNLTTPGIQTFPDVPGDSIGGSSSNGLSSECALLKSLSKLQRLRRLDLRFNRCNSDLYAAPPTLPSQSLGSGGGSGSGMSLEGPLSPQMPGQGDGGPGVMSSARVDEDAWLKQDHVFVLSLKFARQSHLLQRRDNYWRTAVSLFSRLEEFDGIKVGSH
ncbi:Leucine-rich repeat protein [Kickxella alabastrina]|uniref:Leucine-rich repeat protein n=1 Tax=Kickxella alabastrina TaxID=61397 RepID=A0ACC1IWJ3_9FUNG|nr:Leucine-rich repeat protein [Kickxella alabastrina]